MILSPTELNCVVNAKLYSPCIATIVAIAIRDLLLLLTLFSMGFGFPNPGEASLYIYGGISGARHIRTFHAMHRKSPEISFAAPGFGGCIRSEPRKSTRMLHRLHGGAAVQLVNYGKTNFVFACVMDCVVC